MDLFSERTHWIIQCIINNDLDELKNTFYREDIDNSYHCKELGGDVTPLSAAVIFQKMDICDYLLTRGADPDCGANGLPPLYHACKSAPVEFVSKLIKAGARTNVKEDIDGLTMTPLQFAALHHRQDVMQVLIDAGSLTYLLPPSEHDDEDNLYTHSQYKNDDINDTMNYFINELASRGEEMYSKINLFHDLHMALTQKSPREVFEKFVCHMLEENPLNHLTVIDFLFNDQHESPKQTEEYHQKCIKWLKDNSKLNFYIDNVTKRFSNLICYFEPRIVSVLQTIFNTMEEIPSETSLALIPQLLELKRKWYWSTEVLSTLYVITQKTQVNDNWNQVFINNICKAIVPSVYSSPDERMYSYATLANLPFVHTSNFFTSTGISQVPEEVIMSAQMRSQKDMTDRLKQLHKHLSKQTPENETTNTEPSKQPREWNRISKRWSQQLEKLVNTHEDDKVVKVGNVVMGKGGEFRIAGGSDGTQVFLGLRDDGTEVAVKRMTPENYEVLKNEKDFLRLPELDDPSIVRYVDFKEDENYGYLVLQLCEYTLEEYIKLRIEFPGGPLPEQAIAQQVLTSLKILHHQSPSILHRDIKPQNVLIDVTRKARLADFGISRRLTREQTTHFTSSAGTKCWKAKETINEDDGDERVPYKRSVDIQVAGMLLYYILSGGEHPFGKGPRCETNILDGKYNLDHVQDVIAKDLIEMMINEDPKKRPTVEKCLDHPYFWENEKRVDFLKLVGNEEEVEKSYRNPDHQNLMAVLDQCAEDGLFDAWKDTMRDKLPCKVFQELEKWRGKTGYSENGFELLRFIRNLHAHHAEAAAAIDLMEMFPGLFDCVYRFVKDQGWNTRVTLKKMFGPTSTHLKDGGACSSDAALGEPSFQPPAPKRPKKSA